MPDTHPGTRTDSVETSIPRDHHVCPVWVGRLLVSPLRRLVENPQRILSPFVTPGSTVVDVGSAMGFHSLDLARLVGPEGRVVCLDIQQRMLDGLVRRAGRKGLAEVIEPRLCTQEGLGADDLAACAELVTAFNVVHETSFPERFLDECARLLRPGGRLLIVEPSGHVDPDEFSSTIAIARSLGLSKDAAPDIWRSHTAVFSKRS
jgi:ubiquinone/menaquinone biosynthesis C-methylase UbiE